MTPGRSSESECARSFFSHEFWRGRAWSSTRARDSIDSLLHGLAPFISVRVAKGIAFRRYADCSPSSWITVDLGSVVLGARIAASFDDNDIIGLSAPLSTIFVAATAIDRKISQREQTYHSSEQPSVSTTHS